MLRQLLTRPGGLALAVVVLGLAGLTTSCGGGSGYAAKDMVLVEFLFVDRALVPTAPTGTENLPRNAQILMVFSEIVDPGSVDDQTVQIRYGPTGQSVPKGSFSIDGNTVRFDPTVTAQGQPNPFGFDPVTQYLVDIPNYEEQPAVVNNLDSDPNLVTFFTTFVTSDGFLRELDPPEVVRVYSIPDRYEVNPLTGQWPGNGLLAIEFNEPMDPSSFILGGPAGPDVTTSVDVRYDGFSQINVDNDLVVPPMLGGTGVNVSGSFKGDAGATTYLFTPTFSFGADKFVFTCQVFQGLKDLSGNLLVNPRSFGPYTCDGSGIVTGKELQEDFLDTINLDLVNSDGPDWGFSEEGVLQGQEITSREAYLFGFSLQGTGPEDFGQYAPVISPFAGAALNQYLSGIVPPTSEGRRVMLAIEDTEMGPNGSITAAGWGPDSNATFAAIYPTVFLRAGYQKNQSLSLSPSFSGNYDGKATVLYSGSYQVGQAQNVGNTVDSGGDPGGYTIGPIGTCAAGHNAPLWDFTGFEPWPEFNTFFEWDQGDPNVPGDSIFLWDASVSEGDTWQQLRGWFGATFPCSGWVIPGFPGRRLYGVFEGETPNPPSNGYSIINPEPSITDTSFTITKRVSQAQTLFYTDASHPDPSSATTFGADSDYLPIELTPPVQSGGTLVQVEFQAAHACDEDRRTINVGPGPATDWVKDINECDGYECIRWRMFLVSNLISNTRARLLRVVLPVIDMNNP